MTYLKYLKKFLRRKILFAMIMLSFIIGSTTFTMGKQEIRPMPVKRVDYKRAILFPNLNEEIYKLEHDKISDILDINDVKVLKMKVDNWKSWFDKFGDFLLGLCSLIIATIVVFIPISYSSIINELGKLKGLLKSYEDVDKVYKSTIKKINGSIDITKNIIKSKIKIENQNRVYKSLLTLLIVSLIIYSLYQQFNLFFVKSNLDSILVRIYKLGAL